MEFKLIRITDMNKTVAIRYEYLIIKIVSLRKSSGVNGKLLHAGLRSDFAGVILI